MDIHDTQELRDTQEAIFIPEQAWLCLVERLGLSPRECQIARAVLLDQKECAIACRLSISPHTVHTYLERLYRKLGVASRIQLVIFLARAHLEYTSEADSCLPPVCGSYAAGLCPLRS